MITCMPSRNEVTQLTVTGEWSTPKIHEVWKSTQLASSVLFVHCFLFILWPLMDAYTSNLEYVISTLFRALFCGWELMAVVTFFLYLAVSLSLKVS